MASYTSTQSGDFNSAATWGGSGYPSATGDTFTISSGHTVTLTNDNTSVSLGESTINGTLQYSTTGTVGLRFGNANLTVNGSLIIGTEANPITGVAYLYWSPTADNSVGLVTGANAVVSVYGTFNKSTSNTLANNSENTDNDADIILDSSPTNWAVGDELIIRVKKTNSSTIHQNGFVYRTISSINGANITLNSDITVDSGVGNTWVGYVYNISRNIVIGLYGATKSIFNANTKRPNITITNTTTNNVNISGAFFVGLYSICSSSGTTTNINRINISNSVVGFGEHAFYKNLAGMYIYNCIFVSLTYGLRDCASSVFENCNFVCINTGNRNARNVRYINTNFMCNYAFLGFYNFPESYFNNCKFIANYSNYGSVLESVHFYSCSFADNEAVYPDGGSCNIVYSYCKLGYDGELSEENTRYINTSTATILRNCTYSGNIFAHSPTSPRTYRQHQHYIFVENPNGNNTHFIYQSTGISAITPCNGVGNNPSVDISGGNGNCVRLYDLTSRLTYYGEKLIAFKSDQFVIPLSGSSQTLKFYIQSTFSTALTSDKLYLEVMYYNNSGNLTVATSTNTVQPRTSKSDWSQYLSVSITGTSIVSIQIYLTTMENDKEIYIGIPPILE